MGTEGSSSNLIRRVHRKLVRDITPVLEVPTFSFLTSAILEVLATEIRQENYIKDVQSERKK